MGESLHAIVLAGGSGTRLWPLSRGELPKQFLHLFGNESLFQGTLKRLRPLAGERIRVVSPGCFSDLVLQQSGAAGMDPKSLLLVEPCAKNTAPAIALGIASLVEEGCPEETPVLVCPSDHVINEDEKFMQADVGVSGVNFAVAETGTLLLVENEGNGRMSTTVPPVHIAVTGIEKVVENLRDVVPLVSLLTRSALGQPITTYVNMISGPRKPGELDGPEEVHLVLLDNGRSQAFADSELRQTLNCIRCGACMNHCPVYTRIGGHAYGEVYPGPIGAIITPHMVGLNKVPDHPSASSLCGACGEVCPVKIPIPALLRRLREENVKAPDTVPRIMRGQGSKYSRKERLIWNMWAKLNSSPALYRTFLKAATRLRALTPSKVGPWTQNHSAPKPAARSLHDMAREHLAKKSGETR